MTFDIKSEEYLNDPYAKFKRLRTENPVCRITPFGHWAIMRYCDVEMVLKNPHIFSSTGIAEEPSFTDPQFLLLSRGLIGKDGEEHIHLRRVLRRAFTPKTITDLEPMIRKTCASLVSNLISYPSVNFMETFAIPLPIAVISALLGINEERKLDFKHWVDLLLSWRNYHELSDAINEANSMMQYFTQVIAERTQHPAEDLISKLVLSYENQQIAYETVISFIRLILVAGTDTTTSLLANAILILTQHPKHMQAIQENPNIISHFIEEVLRYDSPTISLSRRAVEDTQIAGIKIKKHDIILPIIASANRDETVFSNPETFDLELNTRHHLALGTGVHYCLGSQLARMQVRIALEEISKGVTSLKTIDDKPLQYLNSFFFRSIRSLDLRITPK